MVSVVHSVAKGRAHDDRAPAALRPVTVGLQSNFILGFYFTLSSVFVFLFFPGSSMWVFQDRWPHVTRPSSWSLHLAATAAITLSSSSQGQAKGQNRFPGHSEGGDNSETDVVVRTKT